MLLAVSLATGSGPAVVQNLDDGFQDPSLDPFLFLLDMANKVVLERSQSGQLFFLIVGLQGCREGHVRGARHGVVR